MKTTLLAPPAAPELPCPPHGPTFASPRGLICSKCFELVHANTEPQPYRATTHDGEL